MNADRSFHVRAVIVAGAAVMLTLVGCYHGYSSGDATTSSEGVAGELAAPRPMDTGMDFLRGRAFISLAVGNRWDYHTRTRSQIFTDGGSQPPQVDESDGS